MRIGQSELLVVVTLALGGGNAFGQGTYRTSASPPDATYLSRLNLKTEWTATCRC